MEKKQEKIDEEQSINRYFGLVVPYIIFLGMIRLMFYYSHFGVSIVSYLDISEVITSFFDVLMLIVSTFVIITFNRFIAHDKKKGGEMSKLKSSLLKEEDQWKIVKLYFKYLKTRLLLLLIFVSLFLICHLFLNLVTFWEVIFLASFMVVVLLYVIITIEIERKHLINGSSPGQRRYIGLIFYSLILIISVMLFSKYQINEVEFHHSTKGTTIILKSGEEIVSKKQKLFIGKTNNYVFFFDKKTKTTDIFPMSEIKMLKIKKRKIH